jgi:PPIC-type PPIASE domain
VSRTIIAAGLAIVTGALLGEFLSRTPTAHRLVGRLFHRGKLIAVVSHRGVFQAPGESPIQLIADEVLRVWASRRPIDNHRLARVMFALRCQFGDDKTFAAALRENGISKRQLTRMAAATIRSESWIEEKLPSEMSVTEDQARQYFQKRQADFAQPLRIRPRHIFMAAPQGTPNLEEKRAAMQEIVARVNGGEDFAALAAAVSEDEATKARGGDLGFIASNRVPPEFWGALETRPVNAPAAFVQSHLGFHAVQVMEMQPARQMTFEEARPEIEQLLAAEKRRGAVKAMRDQLAEQAVLVSR